MGPSKRFRSGFRAIVTFGALAILLVGCPWDDGGGGDDGSQGKSENISPPPSPPPSTLQLSVSESPVMEASRACADGEDELPAAEEVAELVLACWPRNEARVRYWNISPTTLKVWVYADRYWWENYESPPANGLFDDVLTYGIIKGVRKNEHGYFYVLPSGAGVDMHYYRASEIERVAVETWPEHGEQVFTAKVVADLMRELSVPDADRPRVSRMVAACAWSAVQLADQVSTTFADPEGIRAGIEKSYETAKDCKQLFDDFTARLNRQKGTVIASGEVAKTVATVTSQEGGSLLGTIGKLVRSLRGIPHAPV